MKKILLGLHGGATGEGAVNVARLLRERTGAMIDAVAVLEPLPVMDYGYGAVFPPDPAVEDALQEELRAEARAQLARCGLDGVELSVLRGPRASTLNDRARAQGEDLIVVGIGPHRIADRALGGETALQLAQHASTPVLAVPAEMHSLPHHILAAVDFSPASLAAADMGASFLMAGDRLDLVYIGAAAQIGAVVLGPAHLEEASRRLEEFASHVDLPSGVQLSTRAFGGEPTRTLLKVTSQIGATLIALGSHGYSMWQRVLIGSVSSKVLRLAECAVLIYPARCVSPTAAAAVGAAPGALSL